MLSIRDAPTWVLRSVLRQVSHDPAVVETWSRRLCIDTLERRHLIFYVSEDGIEYGLGPFAAVEPAVESHSRSHPPPPPTASDPPPPYSHDAGYIQRSDTDAAHDVIFAEKIHVHDNLFFADGSDIRSEIHASHQLLTDIHHETAALSANIHTFQLNLENPAFDIATTNQMGTMYDLRLHVDQGVIEYDHAVFRCMRSDLFVFVCIQCRITRCDDVNMIEIDLPYPIVADHVPFQANLKETESADFSGMVRAYGRRGHRVFVESYVFRELPNELIIRGQYVTSPDAPLLDTSFQNPRPFTWITPMRHDTFHETYLNRDMVETRDVPDGSDLGFSDGYLHWTRVQNRMDLSGWIRFRQRTHHAIERIRCDVRVPLSNVTFFSASHGYGATYMTEYRQFLTERPNVVLEPDAVIRIDASTQRVLFFHEAVVQFHVSVFVVLPSEPHALEKPVVQATTTVENKDVHVTDIRLFDTWNPKTLFHTYQMDFRILNDRDTYQEYRFVPLTLELQYRLEHKQLDLFDIRLYNQLDEAQVEYLYPRRQEYSIHLHATNYLLDEEDGYQGPFELTPDFSTYLDVVT